ncbi:hypothetical protein NE237_016923 [Protea cynaroides]|uniref:PGG domain-containing protein n=1 Tax=Protea cynaroides TaxID=273540 RepID=A0A9Q0K5Y5_9MAGN|nr:hypothetical protein NE237_016923 [Protea cynaroides]
MWRERTNKDDKTARALFTEEHKELVAEAGTWMKDTSTSCMVVATLIVTVLFAAAFTVPGGNNDDNGKPVFLGTSLFAIFLIANMIGLFSSSTSVLMFLSFLTSRYAEEDFLYSLPKKLIIGLATLFISITALIVSFTLTLFIILQSKQSFIIIPIGLMAYLPIYSFTVLQFPLLIEMVHSTYGNAIFNLQEASNLLT